MNDEILRQHAKNIVLNERLALMSTVDENGAPHARWMTTALLDGIQTIVVLSRAGASKVAHVRINPNVCWVFTSPGHTDVVTLYGIAQVHDSPLAVQRVAEELMPYIQNYVGGPQSVDVEDENDYNGDMDILAISTHVSSLSIISPSTGLFRPRFITLENTQSVAQW